jgi:hypothetical protein
MNHPACERFADEDDQKVEQLDRHGDGGCLPEHMILGETRVEPLDSTIRTDLDIAQRRYLRARHCNGPPQERGETVHACKSYERQLQPLIQENGAGCSRTVLELTAFKQLLR